jgi:Arc/MetJ-type ribon-helix-helix transcriptional regulator
VNITLDQGVEDFLKSLVHTGVRAARGEFVNALIRSVREQQQQSFEITPELEAWLFEAADRPSTPLTRDDFDALLARVDTDLTLGYYLEV